MIVSGYAEMKPFLPAINMKGTPGVFDDALDVAQEALAENILGTDLETQLEKRETSDARLLKICQRVISNEAFLRSIPEMDLVLTDSGFGVISSQDIAPASKERVASLAAGLQQKLDAGKDRLVTYLLSSSYSDSWRGTEQFARLSCGLILTFEEFRNLAVYNPRTAEAYPRTWEDWLKLLASMNVALTSDAASYISPDYADELLEKVRDAEAMGGNERKLMKMVKTAIAAMAMGDRETGLQEIIKASAFMKANISDFPTFADSSAAADLTLEHTDTPIFSMI